MPSKALLAASGKVRELADDKHLCQLSEFTRLRSVLSARKLPTMLTNWCKTIRTNLTKTLERAGVTILTGMSVASKGLNKSACANPAGWIVCCLQRT